MKGLDRVRELKGLGPATYDHLLKNLKGDDGLINALGSGDVALLSSIDRISSKLAVRMVLAYRGQSDDFIIGNGGIRDIYDDILNMIRSRMHMDHGRNMSSLLVAAGDINDLSRKSRAIYEYRELVDGRDRRAVESLLGSIGRKRRASPSNRTYPYTILVEDERAFSRIRKMGLDRYCMVISPSEGGPDPDDQLIYVYNGRELQEEYLPIIAAVSMNSKPEEILPDIVYENWKNRIGDLDGLNRLEEEYCREGSAGEALRIMEELSALDIDVKDASAIREIVDGIREEIEISIKEEISSLTLSGTDALSILSSGEPEALRDIYREKGKQITDMMRQRIGIARDVFIIKYPLEIDQEALDRLIVDIEEEAQSDRFRRKVKLARRMSELEEPLRTEFSWVEDLDYRFGLGCLVVDLDLNPFIGTEGWIGFQDGSHLELRDMDDTQPISYHLGPVPDDIVDIFHDGSESDSRISLMTGANSGGKTTLLETMAQIVVMAYMGLPVPARKAFVPRIDGVYLYKPRRSMDAGGLETFLREILPLSLRADPRTLILADELEAMTELEAASKIIGGFLRKLRERDAYAVVVTHMAQGISRYADIRIDGIEAKGLDDDHRLVVDRTPRIGYHARSTPELILKSLMNRSNGDEKRLYGSILDTFDDI